MSTIIKHELDLEHIVSERASFQLYTPDREEERPYRDALAYLVFKWQFFAQLIYSGMEIGYARDLPSAAATDGHMIYLNPPMFAEMEIHTIPEKVFVFGHEVGHRILNHCALSVVWRKTGQVLLSNGSWLPYLPMLMNIAQDFGINAMLKHSGVGKMPSCALYDPTISSDGMEGCVELYEKLWKRCGGKPPKGPGQGPEGYQPGGGKIITLPGGLPSSATGKGFDTHLEPSEAQVQKDKGKREHEIIVAAQIAERTQGTIPGALRRIIDDIVDPKVPWQQYLRTSMLRKAGPPKLDWRFRNRRLAGREPDPMFFAKTAHIGAGTIVCIGDNSGSIGDKETRVFGSEMAGICADLNPLKLVVIWCDAQVTRYEELDEPSDLTELFVKWKQEGVGGGGGTDFRPAFEKVEEMGLSPDMVVFFTDGQGTFPNVEPMYSVIWASTYKHSKYPWGEVVDIEVT